MKKILPLILILTIASCGRSRNGSVSDANIETDTPPTQGSVIADSTYSIDSGSGGHYNVFDKDGLQYLFTRSSIGETYLNRLNSTQLDNTFGTSGSLKLTGTSGVLGIVKDYYVISKKCGDNVYAVALAGNAFPTKIFKGVIGATNITFTDITGDLNTRVGANSFQVGAFFCSKDHFIAITGRGNTAPVYAAYIAVNTATDAISLFVDSTGTQDDVMRSNRSFSYHHAGVDYLIQTRSGGMRRKTLNIDEGNRTITFSNPVELPWLYNKGDQRVGLFQVGTETWLVARDWGNANTVNIWKESAADIHNRISNDNFNTAPAVSFDLPNPSGRYENEALCLTADGKTLAFIGSTSTSNTTAYFYMDLSKSTPEIPLAFNNGQVETFPVSYPYASTSGVSHTAVSCNGGNVFFAYKDLGTNDLRFDRYSP